MKKYIFTISIILSLWVGIVNAQQGITYQPFALKQVGDSLMIHFEVDVSQGAVSRNASVYLTPFIVSNEKQLKLPVILINGKTRDKVYERQGSFDKERKEEAIYQVVRSSDKEQIKQEYSLVIPFEEWMEESRLTIQKDLCGCTDYLQNTESETLFSSVTLARKPVYEFQPAVAFIRPQVEEIKKRSEQRDAFLDFRVSQTKIDPVYMNNPVELEKIESMLKELKDDANLTVTLVGIKGYASPEGSVALNDRLSRGRAESLRAYLANRKAFPADVFHVEQGGEDWKGLEELVSQSFIEYREEVLAIVRFGGSADERELSLKKLAGGAPYALLLKDYFPKLRRVLCRVDYTVRGFELEEAVKIIQTRPQQLSLEEMFLVANSYEMEDPKFKEVFETAVRLFPENEIANLNAAASALQWGDAERGKKYLDKAPVTNGAYLNNLGVYYLMSRDYQRAKDLFERSVREGSEQAKANLKELNHKIEIEEL